MKKKVVSTSRTQSKSPELSSSVKEYPRQHYVDAAVAMTRRVTRRQTLQVAQSATDRSSMKSMRLSTPHTLSPNEEEEKEETKAELTLQADAQDP